MRTRRRVVRRFDGPLLHGGVLFCSVPGGDGVFRLVLRGPDEKGGVDIRWRWTGAHGPACRAIAAGLRDVAEKLLDAAREIGPKGE